MTDVLRIANCSGFYGDRLSAAREMVEGGPIDVLTGDYLAELTLMLLWKDRRKDPRAGYAKTFVLQLREIASSCLERGIKIVVNAGGLAPAACAEACREVYQELGLDARVAHIEGDDLLGRLEALEAAGEELRHMDQDLPISQLADSASTVVSANAYLGGWGIAKALELGADLVICPRVTDAALVLGPAAWRFGWARDDWDRLASAVVAGHVLECGAQATGGNYAFFRDVAGLERPGFPLAEIEADGSFTVTKHPGTGGEVSVGTVTAQLLYEIGPPHYLNPDVTADFASFELENVGTDRVRVTGVRGTPPPSTTKVCINYLGGFKNSVTFVLTGLDIEAKAELAERSLWQALGGRDSVAEAQVTVHRADRRNPASLEQARAFLTVAVKDPDARKVGRRFSSAAVDLALASYPGFTLLAPPAKETPFGVYWPALVDSTHITQEVVFEGQRHVIEATPGVLVESQSTERRASQKSARALSTDAGPSLDGPGVERPLGQVCGARSGDKGGNANLGVWVESDDAYGWLKSYLTVERLRALVPEAASLIIDRHELPNLRALNFELHGFLGDGVASSLVTDPQAKGLGEYLRAKRVTMPERLVRDGGRALTQAKNKKARVTPGQSRSTDGRSKLR